MAEQTVRPIIRNTEVPVVEAISDILALVCWQWWRDEPRVVVLL